MEALSFPYKYYRILLKVALPIIITGGLILVSSHFMVNEEGNPWLIEVSILLTIAFVLSLTMAIVGCHRIFLLGDNVVERASLFYWTGNEIKYIGWWILIGICSAFIAIPFMLILMPFIMSSLEGFVDNQSASNAIMSMIYIPIYYVASRWALVLPSSAIDIHGKNLTWSWRLSAGNGWRLTLLISLLPFLTDIIFSLMPLYESLFFTLLQGTLWLVIGVVEVGLLSLSYKFLVLNEARDDTDDKVLTSQASGTL